MRNTFRQASTSDDLGLRRGQSVSRYSAVTSGRSHRVTSQKVSSSSATAVHRAMRSKPMLQTQTVSARQGRFHRSALLRQHRLRRPVGLLLRLAAPLAEARLPRPLRHARCAQGRGTGRHALSPRQQGEGGGVLPRRHDAGDAPPRRAGASGLPGHHLLRLQAVRERRATKALPAPAGRRSSTR